MKSVIQSSSSRQRAFSLVELSIVLVILGLLAGGVLSGQSLIRAAELRSVMADISAIQSATYSFRDKYFALPGDMTNATQFWGIAGGSTGNDDACYTMTNTDKATCNGNGDGRVHTGYSSTTYGERGHYWKQLANAGLIEGAYAGYHGPFGAEIRRGGYNAKGSKLANTHWIVAYVGTGPAGNASYYGASNNSMELTRDFNGVEAVRDLLRPEELWNIDTKLDDGRPAYGKVRGPKQGYVWAPNCTDSTADTANYNLTLTSKECFPRVNLD